MPRPTVPNPDRARIAGWVDAPPVPPLVASTPQVRVAPAAPAIDQLKDEHRVFPGDGILPLGAIFRDLQATGYAGCVSLELYNPTYWQRDLEGVAREGHEKTLKVIEQAMLSP
jgi:sugar phosphate isomerase/epimerase